MEKGVNPDLVKVGKPFCRVQGVIEGEINFELWLPSPDAWNGRFYGTGNGAFAGYIRYEELARGVMRGFASVSTDTGHTISELHWAMGRPKRLENYEFRAQHLVAVNAKHITEAYYSKPISHSYFMGCSGGGMQAMNEVQRYPADYDGIIDGADGMGIVGISARWLMSALIHESDPAASPSIEDWRKIAAAAVAKCDADDGVKDGIINDPPSCKFALSETPGLTGAKLKYAEELYAPILGSDGSVLSDGFTPGVAYKPMDQPGDPSEAVFGDWTYQDPNWDSKTFNAARDIPLAEAVTPGLATTNPNLEPFARLGGKLIAYQGWTDPTVPAKSTIRYHEQVVRLLGSDITDRFYRLFVAPGMDHCGGGEGPNSFGGFMQGNPPEVDADHDLLSAIVQWVEENKAPEKIIASKVTDGKVVMTRPLCPYPQLARYSVHGDVNVAANFVCIKP
jgi:feruloyl esterase